MLCEHRRRLDVTHCGLFVEVADVGWCEMDKDVDV